MPSRSLGLALALAVLALTLLLHRLAHLLPCGQWVQAAFHPDTSSVAQLTLHFSLLPRVAVALLAGAGLALAGVLLQQVLHNPLAEPATLGISAGAGLAITLVSSIAPAIGASWGRPLIALIGALLAVALVFGLSVRQRFSPLAVLLAGLLVTLYCGAVSAGLQLLANPYDLSFYLWGSGSLVQQDWSLFQSLLMRLLPVAICTVCLIRPLTVMALTEEGAKGLGLALAPARMVALGIATCLAAFVVSAVGVIGFVGLTAPALARACGARRVGQQLLWAPILGGLILWLSDEVVLTAFGAGREFLPTGAATALIGAPLIFYLAPKLRGTVGGTRAIIMAQARHPGVILALWAAILVGSGYVALHLGHMPQGWVWSDSMLAFRWPHLLGAAAAGMLLAAAGVLLQRLTGNALASPDLLGLSEGAACGRIVATALFGAASSGLVWLGSAVGAMAVLGLVLALGGQGPKTQPDRFLLVGIAANALGGVLVTLALLAAGPAAGSLRAWMLGDTGLITGRAAISVTALLPLAGLALFLMRRWLVLLPLGGPSSGSLGLGVSGARGLLLLAAGLMTATATLLVGPLGFVGLMSGHLARISGFHRPLPQLLAASLVGGLIMLLADWAGHTLAAPFMLPAGLLATLIGGPYLLWLLMARGRRARV
ncbi:Fe(3+)-hydroxamate ABC transporter permease FhuB [Acidisoma cellulosilytica]|uniref:Fe(3+)-hydroxamate ABC transporter permease FhuB n=1 Tax=Acidisoma cellulosilyticum TaxID=2802395 RepID=A0A963YZ30_9PROT|nr:Fe(3+)-hydroxamate ABC transporter permease FhuB [Acidisoma cellulosilyticum]MCB8879724.1 Fe(3+)-hydroxamate ABC transporter permease FhuB [Acidisoma cellulosilyticum]